MGSTANSPSRSKYKVTLQRTLFSSASTFSALPRSDFSDFYTFSRTNQRLSAFSSGDNRDASIPTTPAYTRPILNTMSTITSLSSSFSRSNASTLSASDSSVHGLRDQIFANAAVAYPHIIATSDTPDKAFNIVVLSDNVSGEKHAKLLQNKATYHAIVATGTPSGTVEQALRALLEVTSQVLGWYSDTLLGEIEHAEDCAGGAVDFLMVEQGFHFAAEQRTLNGE
ncbi:Hypothetical predicted protein [Lecanosticta acicola]|uniref:Uncharacterized protein n=1 Tax=Lecanosticta acicola TaxID=111012 RepID=A0AAI9EAC5_9PEZI|nr:Hypothetical predicted protein [Lecanosticta acicola]